MSVVSALIRLARRVVESVKARLSEQLGIVEDQVRAPIRSLLEAVVGGIWVGRSADAFVEEVTDVLVPGVTGIIDTIAKTRNDIQHAIDVMDRADEQAATAAHALADQFDNIY